MNFLRFVFNSRLIDSFDEFFQTVAIFNRSGDDLVDESRTFVDVMKFIIIHDVNFL